MTTAALVGLDQAQGDGEGDTMNFLLRFGVAVSLATGTAWAAPEAEWRTSNIVIVLRGCFARESHATGRAGTEASRVYDKTRTGFPTGTIQGVNGKY